MQCFFVTHNKCAIENHILIFPLLFSLFALLNRILCGLSCLIIYAPYKWISISNIQYVKAICINYNSYIRYHPQLEVVFLYAIWYSFGLIYTWFGELLLQFVVVMAISWPVGLFVKKCVTYNTVPSRSLDIPNLISFHQNKWKFRFSTVGTALLMFSSLWA